MGESAMKKRMIIVLAVTVMTLLAYVVCKYGVSVRRNDATSIERVIEPSPATDEANLPITDEKLLSRLARGNYRLLTPGKDYIVVTGDHVKATGQGRGMPTVSSPTYAATNGLYTTERNLEQ